MTSAACANDRQRLSRRTTLALAAGLMVPGKAQARTVQDRTDLSSAFQSRGATGCFALYDASNDAFTTVGGAWATTRFVPASTFKIANSLIALETGAVRDENEVIPTGPGPYAIKAWERQMGMREAIVVSHVPAYQMLARRIGLDAYRTWLARLDFGNRETGTVVDRFWLDGPLAISAVESAIFAARLGRGELNASARAQALVRDILKIETRDGATLYAKTGWASPGPPAIGWWTGWVERAGAVHGFSLNIDMPDIAGAPKRPEISRAILSALQVY